MKRLIFCLFFLAFNLANAQHTNLFLGNDYSTNFINFGLVTDLFNYYYDF